MTRSAHLHRRLGDVHADAQAHVAVAVGRGGLDQGHVDGDHLAVEQVGHLGEEDGGVVGQPLVHRLAGVVADEEGVVPEVARELLVGVGGDAQGPHVEDLGVEDRLGVGLHVGGQRVDQVLGLPAGRADEEVVAPVDVLEDLRLGLELLRVLLPEGLGHLPPSVHASSPPFRFKDNSNSSTRGGKVPGGKPTTGGAAGARKEARLPEQAGRSIGRLGWLTLASYLFRGPRGPCRPPSRPWARWGR